MALEIVFTRQALKALVRMPANDASRVRAKIDQYADDPASLVNNVSRLAGSDYSRLRVGKYRVIILPDGTIVEIIAIGVRGGIYD